MSSVIEIVLADGVFFPEPHTHAFAFVRNELHACVLKGGLDGRDSRGSGCPLIFFEVDQGGSGYACSLSNIALFKAE